MDALQWLLQRAGSFISQWQDFPFVQWGEAEFGRRSESTRAVQVSSNGSGMTDISMALPPPSLVCCNPCLCCNFGVVRVVIWTVKPKAHPCLKRRYPYQAFCQSIIRRPLTRAPDGICLGTG